MKHWSPNEDSIITEHFAAGGKEQCAPLLKGRTASGIGYRAHKLGLKKLKKKERVDAVKLPEGFDETITNFYQNTNGKRRGEVKAFAARIGVPRHWVTKRAIKLGLVLPHKKEPQWSVEEEALLREVPLHNPDKCADIFREHGFKRSPTAIVIRANRLDLSRRFNEGLSANQAAQILGVDAKNFGTTIAKGEIIGARRNDKRLPQQGGSRWIVQPLELRRYILKNLERIDLRKVEKFAFVQLISGQPLERARR